MKKQIKKILSGISGIIVIFLVFFPYIELDGQRHTILYLLKYVNSVDISKYVADASSVRIVVLAQIYMLLFVAALALLKSVLRYLQKKENVVLRGLYLLLSFAIIYINFTAGGMKELSNGIGVIIFPIFPLIFGVLDVLVDAYLNQVKNMEVPEKKESQKKERVIEKPTYTNKKLQIRFFRVYKGIWRNTGIYHIFSGIGIGGILATVTIRNSIKERVFSENTLRAITGILGDALLPFFLVFGFVMIVLLVHYFEKNVDILNMFYILGMKKQDRNVFLAGLFSGAFLFSLCLGILFGWLFINVTDVLLSRLCELNLNLELTAGSILVVTAIWILFFIVVLMFSHDKWAMKKYKDLSKEWMPKKHLKKGMLLSVIVSILLCLIYSNLTRFENKQILFGIILCVYVFIRCVDAYSTKYKNRKEKAKKVLIKNRLRSRSRTVAVFSSLVIMLLIFSISCGLLQITTVRTAENIDTLYPYDVVSYGYPEDRAIYEQLANQYDLQITSVPMVRVCSMDTIDAIESQGQTPIQGQQIGISEESYHFLKKSMDDGYKRHTLNLDKKGEKVYVVHQQDRTVRAQPLDYWLWSRLPLLHIGLPVPAIEYGTAVSAKEMDIGFTYRKVVGEEIGSLTGIFDCTGKQENIVVFSNEYFEHAKELWKTTNQYSGAQLSKEQLPYASEFTKEGPSQLVMIQGLKNEYVKDVKKQLNLIEKQHASDREYNPIIKNIYYKSDGESDLEQSRFMKYSMGVFQIMAYSFLILMLIIAEIISSGDELVKRNELLCYLGMEKKKRFRLMKKDLLHTKHWGNIVAAIVSLGLVIATFIARMFDMKLITDNMVMLFISGILILLINEIIMQIAISVWMRKIERRNEVWKR